MNLSPTVQIPREFLFRHPELRGASVEFSRDDDRRAIVKKNFGTLKGTLYVTDLADSLGLGIEDVLTNQTPPSDVLTPLVTHRIDEQHVSLIGRRERLKKGRPVEALLKSEPIILPTRGTTIRTGFDALIDRLGIRPQIAAEVDDMAMMRLLTRENVGLAVLPPIVVKDELQSGYLREAAALPDIFETFYAITISRRFPNPLIRSLLDTRQ